MSCSRTEHAANFCGITIAKLSFFLLLAWLPQAARVLGQDECTTFPCSISIAQYSLHSMPMSQGYTSSTPAPPPPTPKPQPPAPESSTSSISSSSSSTSSSTTTSSTSSSPLSSSSTSSSAILYQPHLRPPLASTSSPVTSITDSTSGPNSLSSSTFNISSSLTSSVTSSGTTTQLRLPSFSSSSILPLVTSAPGLNSTGSNGTSSSTQCGQCSMAAAQVQVFYWPTASVKSDCARASAVGVQSSPNQVSRAPSNATQSMVSLANLGKTDVIDGFTYTFPSTYVSVVGNIGVSNSCGPLGKTHANPTPVAVQAITTASYASWPTVCRPQGNYVDAVIDTLDIADIACPTWGLSDPFLTTCDGSSYLTATEGPPYNPVILVPSEFLNYDPAWAQCTQFATNGPFLLPCGVYDPPRTLSGQGALGPIVPGPTPAGQSLHPGALSAMPALVSPAQAPSPTALAEQQDPTAQASLAPVQDPPNSQPLQPAPHNDPTPTQNPSNQGWVNSGQNVPGQQNSAAAAAAPAQSAPGNSDPGDPQGSTGSKSYQPTDPENPPPSDSQVAAPKPQPVPQTTINIGGQPSGGIGSIINSAFGANPSPSNAGNQGSNVGSNAGSNPGASAGNNAAAPPPDNAAFTPHALSALGASLSAVNPSVVEIGGKTLSAGGPAFTSNGNYFSVGPSGHLVAGTLASGAAPTPAALSFGGQTYKANSAGQFIVAGQTLAPGGIITVSGTPISEAAGASFAVVGDSTQSLITPAPSQGSAQLTFGGSTYTANSNSQFVIGGQTLTPGGQITVSGTAISEGASGSGIVVVGGSSTQSLGHGDTALMTNAAVMTFGDQTVTANAAGDFVVDGQTLTPGGVITVSGTPISEGAGASNVVIGSSTEMLSSVAVMMTGAAVMTFDGQTYTADGQGDFTIDGQTLTPGGMITVSGTPISEAKGATDVVIGTSTEILSTAAVTQSAMAFEGQGKKIQGLSLMKTIAFTGLLIWLGGIFGPS